MCAFARRFSGSPREACRDKQSGDILLSEPSRADGVSDVLQRQCTSLWISARASCVIEKCPDVSASGGICRPSGCWLIFLLYNDMGKEYGQAARTCVEVLDWLDARLPRPRRTPRQLGASVCVPWRTALWIGYWLRMVRHASWLRSRHAWRERVELRDE